MFIFLIQNISINFIRCIDVSYEDVNNTAGFITSREQSLLLQISGTF